MNEATSAAPAAPSKRRKVLSVLALIFLGLGAGYAYYQFTVAQFREVTDDAYVNGNLVYLNAQVSGTVTQVTAEDTQSVKAGQVLVVLDNADAKVALAAAEAKLAQVVRQMREQYRAVDAAEAVVAQRQTELNRALIDSQRRHKLAGSQALSNEEVDHATAATAVARDALTVAQKQLASAQAAVENTPLRDHPAVKLARAEYVQASLTLQRNSIPAPIDGVVARRTVQVGQRVVPGSNLMALVPLDALWVDANLKEVQLEHVRIGQPVLVTADIYGAHVSYRGKVVGMAAGTGGAFSLLPPQNAVGNWIKVVQRVPVRIALEPADLLAHPLRMGLSTQVEIDTHDRSGAEVAQADGGGQHLQTSVFDGLLTAAEQQADAIIQREAGSSK